MATSSSSRHSDIPILAMIVESVLASVGAAALALQLYRATTGLATAASHGHHLPPTPPKLALIRGQHGPPFPYFATSRGLALYFHTWLPRSPEPLRGVVFLSHGLAEHGGRYDHVARELTGRGLAVLALDHQGHGRSDGERLYATHLGELGQDFVEFVQHAVENPSAVLGVDVDVDQWRKLPRFLLGHSMGGVVALQALEKSQQVGLVWRGVVLSGAAFYCSGQPDGSYSSVAVKVAGWLPKIHLPPIGFDKLGDDADVFERWVNDPLRPKHGATIGLAMSLVTEGVRFTLPGGSSLTADFPCALYVTHGESDTLTFPQGSKAFADVCQAKDKTLRLVPGALHELLQLHDHQRTLTEIADWIDARV